MLKTKKTRILVLTVGDRMNVKNVEVTVLGEPIPLAEIEAYITYIQSRTVTAVKTLTITVMPDNQVILDYTVVPQKFERIRRITGYLVGTIDRWNNAKRSEEHDRVKHNIKA